MAKTRLEKQLDFILEVDQEKNILRQTHLSRHGRRENDAEHAWHMALMCCLLKEYANEPFDLARTLLMILIHDVVEIDAGDTYAYAEAGKATQAEREKRASQRIFGLLPEDQKALLLGLFAEFEAGDTPEAKFAHVMDNFQPLLLNDANGGGDWKSHGVHRQQVEQRNTRTGEGSQAIWSYMQQLIQRNVDKGSLGQ